MTIAISIFVGLVAITLLPFSVVTTCNAYRKRRWLKIEAEEEKRKENEELGIEVRRLILVRSECVG